TTRCERATLRAGEFGPLVARRALGVALLRFRRERRHAALRPDDHRGPHAERDLRLAAIEAELRELVVRLGAAALGGGQRHERFLAVLARLLLRVVLLRAELTRPLEPRARRV